MSSFNEAVLTVLKHEGGLVNDKDDPGGITNYGISLRFLKSTGDLKDYDLDDDGDIDARDIKNMTLKEAECIYKKYWWDKFDYSRILPQPIATKLLDTAVNMGQQQAVKQLQRACNYFTKTPLVVDGLLGSNTLLIVNQVNVLALLNKMRSECALFYQKTIGLNPQFKKYWIDPKTGKPAGWQLRAYS